MPCRGRGKSNRVGRWVGLGAHPLRRGDTEFCVAAVGGDGTESGLVHSLLDGGINFLGSGGVRLPRAARAQRPDVPGASGQVRRGRRGRRGVREALASGGADGAVILWDVVAETGLFRLMGHRVPVTGVSFFRPGGRRGDRRADDLRRRLAR